ncbi:MAG TPA: hypothetical protein VHC22_09610 [Pirellulales bacterium]|nr:hypothetical protein [Pirellulales bacterium]
MPKAWIAVCVLLVPGALLADSKASRSAYRTYASSGWNVLESENFRFCSRGRLSISNHVVEATEALRNDLAEHWLATGSASWQPKCDVILHATSEAYTQAVPGGGQTVGCSVINTNEGRITGRRIDIRADKPGWFSAALGHELTHIVLADMFPDGRLPAWADEGMAVLADTSGKQDAHFRDLRSAQSKRQTFRLVELFALDGYPSPDRQAAFYGQSASLVQFLVTRGTPDQFVRFVRTAGNDGYETAARDVYGFQGVRDLEHRWLQQVDTTGALARDQRRAVAGTPKKPQG